MTNDTSTLQGSLYECKDQLIYELGEQGVTATYDPTTGLLGLIHKISDIQGETIALFTNKNDLSHADSETATLTAIHSQGSGKSISVYNAISGTKIGDMTDNGDGTYSYTYSTTGVGDISMTCATTTLESNSITIHDYLLYDPTTINNTSRYTTQSGLSFTFDTDHYILKNNSSGNKTITKTWTTPVNSFKLEMDIYITSNVNNTQLYFDLSNNSQIIRTKISPIDNLFGIDDNITPNDVPLTNFQKNKWYHLIIEYNSITGGTAKLYDGDTLMYSVTNTSLSFTNLNTFTITNLWESNAINYIKNIKIIQPPTFTLVTNKEVLSYYNNEYATLTAIHTDGTTGLNVAVYNAVSGAKIGDMTDNGDGTYTYTYSATGIGDISMTATSGTLESNAITIEDCIYYDSATTDKSSNYNTISLRDSGTATVTFNSNGYYEATVTQQGETGIVIPTPNLEGGDNLQISYDAYAVYQNGKDSSVGVSCYFDSSNMYTLEVNHQNQYWYNIQILNGSMTYTNGPISYYSTNTWYPCIATQNNNNLSFTEDDGVHTDFKLEKTIPTPTSSVKYCIPLTWNVGAKIRFKNIKVKPL